MLRRVASVVLFCSVALAATLLVQLIWSGLLAANLRVSAAVPWSVVLMALLLWVIWRYCGGAWWPAGTRPARRRYRRAAPVPPRVFALAMGAGFLALGTLIGLWLVMGQVAPVPGNPSANFANYSPMTVVSVIAMASLVGGVSEELGLRGYMLTRLESNVAGWAAVFIVALAIAPGHGFTQGFVLPTLLWYFAADVMFGFLSLLVGSILPGIVVHTVGLLIFFSVIWPTDRYRHAAGLARQAPSFWIELLACVVFGALSVLAFLRLAATVQSHSELKGQAGGSSPGPQPGVR